MDFEYNEGPFGGLEVKLVGGQTLHVAGDGVRILTEVANTMGKVQGVEEFLVLDNDAEDIVMGVYWFQRVTNGRKRSEYPNPIYEKFWSIYVKSSREWVR